MEEHYYNARHTALHDLGLNPTLLSADVLDGMLDVVMRNRENVDDAVVAPRIRWKEST